MIDYYTEALKWGRETCLTTYSRPRAVCSEPRKFCNNGIAEAKKSTSDTPYRLGGLGVIELETDRSVVTLCAAAKQSRDGRFITRSEQGGRNLFQQMQRLI
jgi:hypothetical protein